MELHSRSLGVSHSQLTSRSRPWPYPFPDASELGGLVLKPRGLARAQQEELSLEVEHGLLDLARRHAPDLRQLLLPLGSVHGQAASWRCRGAGRGALLLQCQAGWPSHELRSLQLC